LATASASGVTVSGVTVYYNFLTVLNLYLPLSGLNTVLFNDCDCL